MKKLLIIGLLASAAVPVSASHMGPDEALQAALGRISAQAPGPMKAPAAYRLVWSAVNENVYAFNREGGGYLIASGDETMGAPLIGYSYTGSIDPSNMPPAMVDMLEAYSTSRVESPVSRAARENIPPLLSTTWDQSDPYNRLCPEYGDKNCVTGCAATAIAQVLTHYRYPACPTGTGTALFRGEQLTLNLDEHPIDWDNVIYDYTGQFTDAQAEAVANLMRVTGFSISMEYGDMSSGAAVNDCILGLTSHMKFDKSMRSLRHSLFTDSEWNKLVYDELAANRPLVYFGFNLMAGHAFVCDGYDGTNGDYFHINWGWSGLSDGYFLLSNLTPTEQGTGGSDSGYNKDQEAFFNMMPDAGTQTYAPSMGLFGSFGPRTYSLLRDKDVEFTAIEAGSYGYKGFYNVGVESVAGNLGIKITDTTSGQVTYAAAAKRVSIPVKGREQSFTIASADMPGEGGYTVTPAFKLNGTEWMDLPQEGSYRTNVTLTVTDKRFKFTVDKIAPAVSLSEVTYSPSDAFVNTKPVQISATVNATGEDFTGSLLPVLCQGTSIVNAMKSKAVTARVGEPLKVEWDEPFEMSLAEGEYNLFIIREADLKGLYGPVPVRVVNPTAVEIVDAGSEAAPEYFDLLGYPVASPAKGHIYIVRRGSNVSKIIY